MQRKTSQGKVAWRWLAAGVLAAAVLACDREEPLTAQKAQEIISRTQFAAEPVYAEVPRRVWWNESAPKDDYDEKSLRTFTNLEAAGLITVTHQTDAGGTTSYLATATKKGFPILGTAPSFRGPVYRGKIAEKVYDGVKNFERHPSQPTVGHAQLVWHYTNPTPLYPLFETKINKPLNKPFAWYISFYYKDFQWRFDVTVRKTDEL